MELEFLDDGPPPKELEFLDDDPPRDGKIINSSYSTNAPHVRPSFFRYSRHESTFKFLLLVTLVLFFGGGAVGAAGDGLQGNPHRAVRVLGVVLEGLGMLACLLGVGVALLMRWLWKKTAEFFENGLLTPGIVLSPIPLEVAVMANMSNGMGEPSWGIRRLALSALPVHGHDAGTRVPFVSTFVSGEHPDRWADFNPIPISYGSGHRKSIEACIDKTGGEAFDRLAEAIRHGLVPFTEDDMTLVDGELHVLETVRRPGRAAS